MPVLLIRMILFFNVFLPHGDLDQLIIEISRQIEADPDNMELRVRRGEYFNRHEEYKKAKADLTLCLHRGYSNSRVWLALGQCYLNTANPDSSLYAANQILQQEPEYLSALELKSLAFEDLNDYCSSAQTLMQLLNIAEHPSPVLFIRASTAWHWCQEDGDNAISVLVDGADRLNKNHLLLKYLITAYMHSGRYDDALKTQSVLIEQAEFKVGPFIERAKIYIQINDLGSAKADLKKAMSHWDALPLHKKEIPAMKEMKNEIESLIVETGN